MKWQGVRKFVYVFVFVIIIWFLVAQAVSVEEVLITINVVGDTTEEELATVLDVLEERNVSATFFVVGGWALEHEYMTKTIAERHEIGCFTKTESRLAQLGEEALIDEIVGCKEILENITEESVIGFRAPTNDIGGAANVIIAEHYTYDSSLYRRYEWFWEPLPPGLVEVPVTSALVMPLDDDFGLRTFRMGESFFWLIRRTRQDLLVLSFTPKQLAKHTLDFEYLLAHFQQEATVGSVQEWLE